MSTNAIQTAALEALAAGLNVLPPREDGSKAPDAPEWASRQHRLTTEAEIMAMYANGRTGLGVVTGAVSGGLELFEFEGRAVAAGLGRAFVEAAAAAQLGPLVDRIHSGYSEHSPGGGLHWLYRCPNPTTTKLARTEERLPLIETKGEGGYAITAPSAGRVHPTGKPWRMVEGRFATIATISADEHEALHRIARTFDQAPRPAPEQHHVGAPEQHHVGAADGSRPGDDFNARATWAEVLEPHGWTRVYDRGDTGHWRRPGKEGPGISATTDHLGSGLLYVFTSSTIFEPERSYDRFASYAALSHGGDFAQAARTLSAEGYGAHRRDGVQVHRVDGVLDHHVDGDAEEHDDGHLTDEGAEEALAELERIPANVGPKLPPEVGWSLLDAVEAFLVRFVAFPSKAAADAVALWVVHSWALAAAESTPRLALLSAEKRSGKSRLLELLELLVAHPVMTASMSAAALFRTIEAAHPTLLMDEVDTVFGKANEDRNEELRGLLNAGHRRGAMAYRCAGPKMSEVKAYTAFAPVALAGIGELPSTIGDRSITIKMKRRRPDEEVERFRRRKVAPAAARLSGRIEAWATANVDTLAAAEPGLPEALDDRAADGWEPLLAIADAAGGPWPARARRAALQLSADKAPEDDTVGVRLLADCRTVFEGDRMSSADLAALLSALEDAPWGAWFGHPLDARGLARLLRRYDVVPKKIRHADGTMRGYERSAFDDAWGRYLGSGDPLSAPSDPVSSEQPEQPEQGRSEPISGPEQAADVFRSHTPSDLPCSTVPVNTGQQGANGVPTSWAHAEGGGNCVVCGGPTLRRAADDRLLHATCAERMA